MQNKLLPCPICNKEVSIALMGSEEFHYWWMITRGTNKAGNKNCNCRLFMESEKFIDVDGGEEHKQDLIEKWNTRKPMEQIIEQLEEHCEKDCTGYCGDCDFKDAIAIIRNCGKEGE